MLENPDHLGQPIDRRDLAGDLMDQREIVWIEEWMGGALAPREVERLTAEFAMLKTTASERLMVTPKNDIRVNGQIKEARKLL